MDISPTIKDRHKELVWWGTSNDETGYVCILVFRKPWTVIKKKGKYWTTSLIILWKTTRKKEKISHEVVTEELIKSEPVGLNQGCETGSPQVGYITCPPWSCKGKKTIMVSHVTSRDMIRFDTRCLNSQQKWALRETLSSGFPPSWAFGTRERGSFHFSTGLADKKSNSIWRWIEKSKGNNLKSSSSYE